MKKAVFITLAVLVVVGIILLSQEPSIEPGTKFTATGIVVDRAMASNTPYLSIEFPDGTGICLWDPEDNKISNDILIGDEVTVIYGKESGKDRYILLEIE